LLQHRLNDGRKILEATIAEVPAADSIPSRDSIIAEVKALEETREGALLQLKEWEVVESQAKARDMVGSMEREYEAAQKFANSLSTTVDALAGPIKASVMKRAEMPLPGLEYREGAFYVGGVSVDNLSSSLSLKLAVNVARKLAKKTKLICIDGAEQLDEESYKALHQEISGDGFVYWVSKVGAPFQAGAGDRIIAMEGGKASVQQ